MAAQPFSIVTWYNGRMGTANNVYIQNVLSYSDDDLENKHDFIQLLFPLPWRSRATNVTFVATDQNYITIRGAAATGKSFRKKMLDSLKHILAMFDLYLPADNKCVAYSKGLAHSRHRGGGRRILRIQPREDDKIDHAARAKRLQDLANPGNHHHRRITRIIRSLRLCGRPAEADSVYRFFRRFAMQHRTVPRKTLRMWGIAAHSLNLKMDPSEEYKGASNEIKMGEASDGDQDPNGNETEDSIKAGGVEPGAGGGGGSGTSSSRETLSPDRGENGPFRREDTPPGVQYPPKGDSLPNIGDPRMSGEDLEKLTPAEKRLHYGRIQHTHENRGIEIGLNLRNADGKWIAVDKDPMTINLIELRIWQIVLRDLEVQRQVDEIIRKRVEEGKEPDDEPSSDSSDDDDPNDDREFIRKDVKGFGQRDMSPEDLQKLAPWENKLHLAQIEHMSDYRDIEIKFKFRSGDGIWRDRRLEPITLNLRDLKEWQIELDKLEGDWMDEVMRGERRRSADIESDTGNESEYEIGDPAMSERYFEWLGDEDKQRHFAISEYNEKFRPLEYELGFRDRTTYQWVAAHMDPYDMNLEELDQWNIDMGQMEEEWMAKQDAANEATAGERDGHEPGPAKRARRRSRSIESIEMEEIMAERVKLGLDPLGDFPEATRWKDMMEEIKVARAAKAGTEKTEAARPEEEEGLEAERGSDGPGDQLRTEAAARTKTARSSGRSENNSNRSKRRRVG
ncbi:hypothetical protein V498_03103 [Pseudogymnoascus sp. VKM F-4517 (FW-2822)]|nr:hypothetical protein V498_03103 [Pseudogymnoascus sp. VKM F-4517 (FW-2822)]